jgi:hypothetical protein
VPSTLVDAGIIIAALNERDRDFLVYRLPDRSRFKVIPGGRA